MKEFVRELIIYQLVAVVLTLLDHPDSSFLSRLPVYLIVTNSIAWSIRSIFVVATARLDFLHWRRHWQIVFGLPAVATGCFVGALIASLFFKLFFDQKIGSPILVAIFKASLPAALIVTILILAYYAFRDRLETQAIERERLKGLQAKAELAALQSKLNPHFLFNTLNTMVNLVHKEPDKVEEMILRLSDIYRKVLKLPSSERISLAEEFDLARHYLAIEQVRLGDRLHYDIQLPDDLRETSVPPLVVQPLVENAVIHGIMPAQGERNLRLSAERDNDKVLVVVEDDGVGMDSPGGASPQTAQEAGYGLHSTRERLRLSYGVEGNMTIASPPGRGTRITLELPL